jgi:hypothetical protein
MMSTTDNPLPDDPNNSDERESTIIEDRSPETNQQSNRNIHKRPKEGDDSFEQEHRNASSQQRRANNDTTKYFNNSTYRKTARNSERDIPQQSRDSMTRVSFPPFRLSFTNDQTPSELSIIKDINGKCNISLSYGRYSSFGKKKSFLIYANSAEQFDRLMSGNVWPPTVCNLNYILDAPSKTPAAYSIVVLHVPVQWSIDDLRNDIKKQYSTAANVERLFVRGGKPISKVRIDFSSNKELSAIIKSKRILFDEANTSFQIEPYVPPTKVLRCYNCQQYNDHTALNCPNKEKPVCFRCGQSHPYDPNCLNKICCARCHGEHMTGNPSCPNKIEERSKRNEEMKMKSARQQQRNPPPPSVWTARSYEHLSSIYMPGSSSNVNEIANGNGNVTASSDISNKLDALMAKINEISTEQLRMNKVIEDLHLNFRICRHEVDSLRGYVVGPLIKHLGEIVDVLLGKCNREEKVRLRLQHTNLMKNTGSSQEVATDTPQSNNPSPIAASNEPSC